MFRPTAAAEGHPARLARVAAGMRVLQPRYEPVAARYAALTFIGWKEEWRVCRDPERRRLLKRMLQHDRAKIKTRTYQDQVDEAQTRQHAAELVRERRAVEAEYPALTPTQPAPRSHDGARRSLRNAGHP